MISLHTPYDTQLALQGFLKQLRKNRKLSVTALAKASGVPNSTIRKFEASGNISLRQFLMLYDALGNLNELHQLTKSQNRPQTIEEVLKNA
ncbi:helix-turn-helix domain-containing protein [Serratia sp. OS31]|uniref:helix-turn-helix domain-containing protein n=1 Tax=Serratia sp. OS31 TaxID=2760844 RepID=UPI001601905F|nr:helix-turn-helix transcriptional regulator [Serratia sp. OS31]MBB1581538.1 helix-turn-helix transcriptional regulator [Serratia sp. OS31]NLU18251.1 helix-turn-helix transcriptional regulator [Serratia liquefaciens]